MIALRGAQSEGSRLGLGLLGVVAVLCLVVLGALMAHHPGTILALVIIAGLFAFGLLASVDLVFPLLGFLIVFDSVFSLGTQVNSSTLTIIGFSISNPLLVGLTSRFLAEAAIGHRRLSSEGVWIGGTVFFGAILSSYLSTGGFTRATATYMGAGILVVVVMSAGDSRLIRRLLVGIAVGTLFAALSGLLGLLTASGGATRVGRALTLIGHTQIPIPRISGLYQNPDALAFALVVGLFAALVTMRTMVVRLLIACIIVPILLFTYTRGPIAGVMLGCFAYAALRYARRTGGLVGTDRTKGLGVFSITLFVGAALLLIAIVWAGRSAALARFWNPQSVTFRLQIAKVAIETWRQNPLLGIGPGQFLARFLVEAHDTFLQVGAEMGLVGFLPVVVLYLLALTRSARLAISATSLSDVRFYGWICAGVIAVSVVAATLTLLGVKAMWAFLAAACAPSKVPSERTGRDPDSGPRTRLLRSSPATWS